MPIWLRKFTFYEIKTQMDKENEEIEKINKGNTSTVTPPEFSKHLTGKGSYKKD